MTVIIVGITDFCQMASKQHKVFRLPIHSLRSLRCKVSDGTRFQIVINDVMYRRKPNISSDTPETQTALLTIQSFF